MKDQQTAQQNAYKQAGVDIDEGGRLVDLIGSSVSRTKRSGVMGGLGGFGACFDVKAAGYRDPVLVAATDGVGTKLRIAIESDIYDTVGIDLVAMCANDLVVQGAEPLFFLDYFACGKLDADKGAQIVGGIARGCEIAGCALIGGETAEMPGMYHGDDFDLAGFCVGAAERGAVITGQDIIPGDVVLGIASSGLHSNGFSLVRKIINDNGFSYGDSAPFAPDVSLGRALLEPTRIYVRPLLDVLRKGYTIKGLAHITGGGLLENIPRVLPEGVAVALDAARWPCPPVFEWLARSGGLEQGDMTRTLNCGIGMALICAPEDAGAIAQVLGNAGERVYEIGRAEEKAGKAVVEIENLEMLWD